MQSRSRPASTTIGSIRKGILLLWSLLPVITANAEDLSRSGTFEGQWTVVGEEHEMQFAGGRQVYIVRHRGTVQLEASGELPRAMFSDCLGFGDSKTGATTRCKWTDTAGDHIYSELTATEVVSHSETGRGKIVDGTGKYRGMQGEFEYEAWVYRAAIEEEGTIHAFTDTLRGEWRLP